MLKPLTLSLSLAVALGACSVSMAGLFHGNSGCSTCGLASPQCSAPAAVPSSQCGSPCAPRKKCNLFSGFGGMCSGIGNWCNKPKCYTYTWVLKKKRVWGGCGGCNQPTCNTCTSVAPSGQGYVSPQTGYGYSAAPVYGAPMATYAAPAPAASVAATPAPAPGEMTAAPAGDEAPPAPPAPRSSLLFSTPSSN